jgi:hypothetical protein
MPDVNTTRTRREDGAPSNWDRCLDLLIRRQVPAKFRQWYIRRVEDFMKDLKPTALSALTAEQVTDYLRRQLARSDLADWQMQQTVDALRLLLIDLAQVPAGKGVDWDYWWEGQRTLPPEHATIARRTAMSAEDGAIRGRVLCCGYAADAGCNPLCGLVFGEKFSDRGHKLGRYFHHCLTIQFKRGLVFGNRFFFGLAFVVL